MQVSNDRKKASRNTPFETYSRVWDRFAEELAKSADRHVIALAQSWEESKANYAKALNDPNSKVTRSQLGTAMERGLREISLMLSHSPAEIREPLLSTLAEILREEAPAFFLKDKIKLERIVKRGRVRSENEWHSVRHRVDTIEGQKAHREELAMLYKLLDSFEQVGKGGLRSKKLK